MTALRVMSNIPRLDRAIGPASGKVDKSDLQ